MERKWFFETEENKQKLLDACEKWRGSKYAHMGTQKEGIDCTKLVGSLMVEIGSLKQLIPDLVYPEDWMIHGNEEVVLKSFEEHLRQYNVPGHLLKRYEYRNQELLFGDFLGFSLRAKGLTNHTSVYLGDNKHFHVYHKIRADTMEMTPIFKNRITFFYRLFLVS